MSQTRAEKVTSLATRTALLAGLWWLTVQGRPDAWLVGLPAAVLAAQASIHLRSHAQPKLSLTGLLAFVALFLRESIRGGLDVALRTLATTMRIKPGFRRYRLHTKDPAARVLLISCIGLLPGTLAADLDDDHAELHLLNCDDNPEPQLQRLEQTIARLYCLTLETDNA